MPDDEKTPATPGGSPVPESKPKQGDAPADDTDAKIAAAVESALKAEREAAADKAAREKESAEAEAAKQRGEFEKLYESEKAEREAFEQDNQAIRDEVQTVRLIASRHPDYMEREKFIVAYLASTVDRKLKGAEREKAIAAGIAEYVTANPIQPTKPATAGAPPVRPSGARIPPTRQPNHAGNAPARPVFTPSSRF